jgi:ParB/Sulfiredoxin domain
MRADAHYVDQLDRSQAGPVVRLIATRQIDAGDELPPAVSLSSLSQSIATHGMLQPLLVRRAGSRYQLIAGRKRLAAAVGGGMSDVPCIIHEVSESGAQAIAEAERVPTSAVEPVDPTRRQRCFPRSRRIWRGSDRSSTSSSWRVIRFSSGPLPIS